MEYLIPTLVAVPAIFITVKVLLHLKDSISKGGIPIESLAKLTYVDDSDPTVKHLPHFFKSKEPIVYLRPPIPWMPTRLLISDLELVKELFVKNGSLSSGRPDMPKILLHMNPKNTRGIATIDNNKEWSVNRKIFLTFMRQFGRDRLVAMINEESKFLIEEINRRKSFDPTDVFQKAVCNIISTFIFGSRFDYEDGSFDIITEAIIKMNREINGKPPSSLVENIVRLFCMVTGYGSGRYKKALQTTMSFLREKILETHACSSRDGVNNLIEAYIYEVGDEDSLSEASVQNLQVIILELFFAGTETTATTLQWAMATTAKHEKVQSLAFEELDHAFGESELTFEKMSKLHYFTAFQHEIQRFGATTLGTIAHSSTGDIHLSNGTFIPKNTNFIYANTFRILRDPKLWKFPKEFNVNNFLDENGHFEKNDAFVVYGTGPRMCLGAKLADLELMLFLGNLIRSFRISSPDDIDLNKRHKGVTSYPDTYHYTFSKRQWLWWSGNIQWETDTGYLPIIDINGFCPKMETIQQKSVVFSPFMTQIIRSEI